MLYIHSIMKIYWKFTTKNENFQIKNSGIFHISAKIWIVDIITAQWDNRGSSNENPQSMFFSRNKLYPCIPQFNCIKVGFKGVKII